MKCKVVILSENLEIKRIKRKILQNMDIKNRLPWNRQ